MADWERLTDILKNASLDRETKLMIIDLLSLNDDPKLEEDIAQLVFDWHAADQAVVTELMEKFDAIKENFDQNKANIDQSTRIDTLAVADDIGREQKIKQIREHIETL